MSNSKTEFSCQKELPLVLPILSYRSYFFKHGNSSMAPVNIRFYRSSIKKKNKTRAILHITEIGLDSDFFVCTNYILKW